MNNLGPIRRFFDEKISISDLPRINFFEIFSDRIPHRFLHRCTKNQIDPTSFSCENIA